MSAVADFRKSPLTHTEHELCRRVPDGVELRVGGEFWFRLAGSFAGSSTRPGAGERDHALRKERVAADVGRSPDC